MTARMDDPVTELVVNAMGYGVMMALQGRDELRAKLLACNVGDSLGDALRADAEQFCHTRADLIEALGK